MAVSRLCVVKEGVDVLVVALTAVTSFLCSVAVTVGVLDVVAMLPVRFLTVDR